MIFDHTVVQVISTIPWVESNWCYVKLCKNENHVNRLFKLSN